MLKVHLTNIDQYRLNGIELVENRGVYLDKPSSESIWIADPNDDAILMNAVIDGYDELMINVMTDIIVALIKGIRDYLSEVCHITNDSYNLYNYQ